MQRLLLRHLIHTFEWHSVLIFCWSSVFVFLLLFCSASCPSINFETLCAGPLSINTTFFQHSMLVIEIKSIDHSSATILRFSYIKTAQLLWLNYFLRLADHMSFMAAVDDLTPGACLVIDNLAPLNDVRRSLGNSMSICMALFRSVPLLNMILTALAVWGSEKDIELLLRLWKWH